MERSRNQKYMEKLKEDPGRYQEYLEKARLRMKVVRERRNTSAEGKRLKRLEAQRKRVARQKAKQTPVSSTSSSFASKQSFGKAMQKLRKALPKGKERQIECVKQLVREIMPEQTRALSFIDKKYNEHNENGNLIGLIKQFYSRDDISYAAPGKRDVRSVKNTKTNIRELIPIRYLVMNISEVFEIFKKENPQYNIGKSYFFNLRPQNVLPKSETPHNVCVCKYHANCKFLIQALQHVQGFPKTVNKLIVETACDISSEACMIGLCKHCYDVCDILPLEFENIFTSYQEWSDIDGRLLVVEKCCDLNEVISKLKEQWATFKKHFFVMNQQSQYFKEKRNSLNSSDCVLQIDFAENYSITFQDEIQAAHWQHTQATIFTACAWFQGKTQSLVVISDDLSHDKHSVWAFLKAIIEDLKKIKPNLENIFVFSDGCAGQFKNKYTLTNLLFSKTDFDVFMDWSFFATAHGKGAVDGVGGLTKRTVWNDVRARRSTVNTPFDFYLCASTKLKNIKPLYVSKDSINELKPELNKRWLHIKQIPNIRTMHYFAPSENGSLNIAITSNSQNVKTLKLI